MPPRTPGVVGTPGVFASPAPAPPTPSEQRLMSPDEGLAAALFENRRTASPERREGARKGHPPAPRCLSSSSAAATVPLPKRTWTAPPLVASLTMIPNPLALRSLCAEISGCGGCRRRSRMLILQLPQAKIGVKTGPRSPPPRSGRCTLSSAMPTAAHTLPPSRPPPPRRATTPPATLPQTLVPPRLTTIAPQPPTSIASRLLPAPSVTLRAGTLARLHRDPGLG